MHGDLSLDPKQPCEKIRANQHTGSRGFEEAGKRMGEEERIITEMEKMEKMMEKMGFS